MLAGLGNAGTWLRRLTPPTGPLYLLWELAILTAAFMYGVYVSQDPTSAAGWLEQLQQVVSVIVMVGCLIAIPLAYTPRSAVIGCRVLGETCLFWASVLITGCVFYDWRGPSFVIGVAFIFAWQTTRRIKERIKRL